MMQRFSVGTVMRHISTRYLPSTLVGCLLFLSISLLPLAGNAVTGQTLRPSQVVGWDDLRPPAVAEPVNPYTDLTPQQIIDVLALLRLERNPENLKQNSAREENQRLRQKLNAEGLNVDELLVQVGRAADYYTQQATTTNGTMDGQLIKLLGYILPLEQTNQTVSEFLLVPFIGACVHVPPPPPNQMIYVKPDVAIDNPGLFARIWIEGTLYPQSSNHAFFRVDGEQRVDVSYAMDLEAITLHDPEGEPFDNALARSGNVLSPIHPINSDYYRDYPFWQRMQAQVGALFTQTMVRIKEQGVGQALPLGLLLAFGYGVLHTLGPGHGKTVIVSYFVGKGGSWQRGVAMGTRIAVVHVISAIAIVILADFVLKQTVGHSPASYRMVRLVSYASIAAIGAWMLRQAVESTHDSPTPFGQASQIQGRVRGGNSPDVSLLYPSLTEQVLASRSQSNRAQSPEPAETTRFAGFCRCLTCIDQGNSDSWISLAVGVVPCSGALLVLLYGLANQVLWPSVLMVIAISLGMAITLSLIGMMAIWGQNRTRRIRPHSQHQRRWQHLAPIVGASCVCLIGLFMFGFTLASAIALT